MNTTNHNFYLTRIFKDDPDAIEKFNAKLERLLKEKQTIKDRPHKGWELSNIGATIRSVKKKIEQINNIKNDNKQLVRNVTYKNGRKCFYYSTETIEA